MNKPELVIRPARPADHGSIAGLLNKLFSFIPPEQRQKLWQWRSEQNPSRVETIPGFVVADQDGQLAAVHGLLPIRIKVGDRIFTASCSCDLGADPGHRSAGMKIKLRTLSPEISPLHISTSANEAANKITLALGGKECPVGRTKFLHPLRASGLLRRMVPKMSPVPRVLLGLLGEIGFFSLVDWFLAFTRLFRRFPAVPGSRIERIVKFDEQADRLWEQLARRYSIIVVRDQAYLNWRYISYPFHGILSLGLYRGDELIGYAITHTNADEDKLRFTALLELVVDERYPEGYQQLLGEVIHRSAKRKSEYIAVRLTVPEIEALFLKMEFQERTQAYNPCTYKNNSPDISDELLADPHAWYLSFGDGDICFFYDPPWPE